MGEVIRAWLRSRLGVIIDLTPAVFGHHCRDGTLFAKLLHSYDVINDTQLNTITPTQDPALARVNLKHLRIWLKFIGVDFDDECLEDISNGKGTASLRVFYQLFLCFETTDRFHFVTLQKNREKYVPTSAKFDVKVVSEEPPALELQDHPLSAPLFQTADAVEWHRKKFLWLVEDLRRQRQQLHPPEVVKEPEILPEVQKFEDLERRRILEEEKAEIEEFTRRHQRSPCYSPQISEEPDPEAAKKIVRNLKTRKKFISSAEVAKSHAQKSFLSNFWQKLESDQERELDEIIASKTLDESQYEKQMIKKLCEIRKEKNRMCENIKLATSLMQRVEEDGLRLLEEKKLELKLWDDRRIEDEHRRLAQLNSRLMDKKLQKTEEYLHQLGTQIANDLTDIAVNCAEYELSNGQHIPRKVWSEWKALFVKGLSIVDSENLYGVEEHREEAGEDSSDPVQSLGALQRDGLLDERDLDDYLQMNPPWSEFCPELSEESQQFLTLGLRVLGHIVHKLLSTASSRCPTAPLPNYPVKAALLGLPPASLALLQNLLADAQIKTVQPKDAINFCLQSYKEEMRNFEFINLTKSGASHSDQLLSIAAHKRGRIPGALGGVDKVDRITDKETQTPRLIPYEDLHPALSNAALVGKSVHELLTRGREVPDDVTVKVLTEYLKILGQAHGWVIIDYPQTYRQAVTLESALSGRPPSSVHSEDNVESIDLIYSVTSSDLEEESTGILKVSRLLPNPPEENSGAEVSSCLTSFIRMKLRSENAEQDGNGCDVDRFYVEQKRLKLFYYDVCDRGTLGNLCRFVIRHELSEVEDFEASQGDLGVLEDNENEEVMKARSADSLQSSDTVKKKVEEVRLKPGEPDWVYDHFPQDDATLEALGITWANLEASYIKDLIEVLSLKRFNFLAVLPYRSLVMKYMAEFIIRSDNRQELLEEFQKAFSEIPEDMRDDTDVKCELHCRVRDFQTRLWGMCDDKRRNAEEKRMTLLRDHWTTMQLVVLVNVYLAIMQIELNRFIDTLCVIEGYYLSMMQKPIQQNRLTKPVLRRIHFPFDESPSIEKGKETSRVRVSIKPPIPDVNESELKSEVMNILLRKTETFEEMKAFRVIKSNIDFCEAFVENSTSSAMEIAKRDDKRSSKATSEKKGKRRSSRRSSKASLETKKVGQRLFVQDEEKLKDMFEEWRFAVMFESTRIKTQLKTLELASQSDIDFLLTTMQNGFQLVEEKILERYRNEVKSVNDMARIFCLAIEHEKSIEEEMTLIGDRFAVRLDAGKFEDFKLAVTEEEPDELRFKMSQLGRLKDIFQSVAPAGNLPQRSFTFILQDLVLCCGEEGEDPLVPPVWLELTPQDVIAVVREIFGDSSYVDWREFLIYGMCTDPPSQDDLLDALSHFRKVDSCLIGRVSKSSYFNIPLWFNETLLTPSIGSWLHDGFELDEYEHQPESSEVAYTMNFESTKSKKRNISFRGDLMDRKHLGVDDVTPEDVRQNLTKELLAEMFEEHKDTINYVQLLLAFCRDEDPRKGLAKALSVTLDCKVCDDLLRGERYVAQLLEEKRNFDMARQEALQLCADLVEDIISDIFNFSKGNELDADDMSLTKDDTELRKLGPILIERLDRPGEVLDPSSLLLLDHEKSTSGSSPGSTRDSDNFSVLHRENGDTPSGNPLIMREESYWISPEALQHLFSDLCPHLVNDTDIFNTGMSLNKNWELIFDQVGCKELNETAILAHRIINHEFIELLLRKTGRFEWKSVTTIIQSVRKKGKYQK